MTIIMIHSDLLLMIIIIIITTIIGVVIKTGHSLCLQPQPVVITTLILHYGCMVGCNLYSQRNPPSKIHAACTSRHAWRRMHARACLPVCPLLVAGHVPHDIAHRVFAVHQAGGVVGASGPTHVELRDNEDLRGSSSSSMIRIQLSEWLIARCLEVWVAIYIFLLILIIIRRIEGFSLLQSTWLIYALVLWCNIELKTVEWVLYIYNNSYIIVFLLGVHTHAYCIPYWSLPLSCLILHRTSCAWTSKQVGRLPVCGWGVTPCLSCRPLHLTGGAYSWQWPIVVAEWCYPTCNNNNYTSNIDKVNRWSW